MCSHVYFAVFHMQSLCMILLLFCNYTCLLVTISYNIVHNWEYREKGVL